jgi:hypothetical protein
MSLHMYRNCDLCVKQAMRKYIMRDSVNFLCDECHKSQIHYDKLIKSTNVIWGENYFKHWQIPSSKEYFG